MKKAAAILLVLTAATTALTIFIRKRRFSNYA